MPDQSMLWSKPVPFWDFWGLRLMFVGAVLGFFALMVSLASSFILYRVADKTQSDADQKIAEANARAALLERDAAELRTANLALESRIAPRSLSVEQQRAMTDQWRATLAGKRVDVISYTLDAEAALLASQIIRCLRAAGAIPKNRLAHFMPLGNFVIGIAVSGADQIASRVVVNTLQAHGVEARIQLGVAPPPMAGDAPAEVDILIGVKPIPIVEQ